MAFLYDAGRIDPLGLVFRSIFMDQRAIGVFDSGLGGLTAAKELSALMPEERIIYLGDSVNMPYGEKTPERIVELSLKDLDFLLKKDVKAVFVACGTATSNALEALRRESTVPVFGVVDASIDEAAAATKNGKIGLLATKATVAAETYQKKILEKAGAVSVTAQACPKFATMVEDGIFDRDDPRVRHAADEYLPPLKAAGVDTVILGCTHYPLLKDIITEYMGAGVMLISAGAAAARSLSCYLQKNDMCAQGSCGGTIYYTTGDPGHFAKTAQRMLLKDISQELTGIMPL